jgi:hypothetical protein
MDEKESKHGFFLTAFIESGTRETAETNVVSMLKTDPSLRSIVRNDKGDSPVLFAKEIEKVNEIPKEIRSDLNRTGFAWYEE